MIAVLGEDRLLRAKTLCLNTIQTNVAWNLHEPRRGQLVLEGIADLVSFLKLCQKLDLLVMLRAGPYICAGKKELSVQGISITFCETHLSKLGTHLDSTHEASILNARIGRRLTFMPLPYLPTLSELGA